MLTNQPPGILFMSFSGLDRVAEKKIARWEYLEHVFNVVAALSLA